MCVQITKMRLITNRKEMTKILIYKNQSEMNISYLNITVTGILVSNYAFDFAVNGSYIQRP
jgi:hypothetical protein